MNTLRAVVMVWVVVLGVGCSGGGAPVDAGGGARDGVTGGSGLCTPECRAGEICFNFHCVAVIDAGEVSFDEDVGVDTGTGCCPLEPPTCGCVYLGGSMLAGACPRVCGEGAPERWVRSRDSFGCERWTPSGEKCAVGADGGVPGDGG